MVLALIGAVVSEFIASSRGLGTVIQAASIIGIAGRQIVRFAHRRVVFWERCTADTTADSVS
ncbi:MAG: hypothetical protein ACK4QW_10980 [Alphaproteobacteria bacterium]